MLSATLFKKFYRDLLVYRILLVLGFTANNINFIKRVILKYHNPKFKIGPKNKSIFHYASRFNSKEILSFSYRTLGLDPLLPDYNGSRAIHYLVAYGSIDNIQCFLNICNEHMAFSSCYQDEYLILKKPHRIDHTNGNKINILHLAVLYRKYDLMDLVLKLDPELVDMPDINGITPIQYASHDGNVNAIEKLISKSTNIDNKDLLGRDILLIAIENKQYQVVKYLLETLTLDPNSKDYNGDNALIYAVRKNDLAILNILMSNKHIVLQQTNNNHYHALGYAMIMAMEHREKIKFYSKDFRAYSNFELCEIADNIKKKTKVLNRLKTRFEQLEAESPPSPISNISTTF